MHTVTMKDFLKAGVHFGHRTRYWNPMMAPYIYGHRNDIHIINLEKTVPLFYEAAEYIKQIAERGGKILFVGTKKSASKLIQKHAQNCGMPYVDYRWLGGMLTNYKTVRQSIKRLQQLEEQQAAGLFDKMIKKEALKLSRDLAKLQRALGGIKDIRGLPDALFIVDIGYEKIAVTEARRLGIPIVGVVDTNHDPSPVDYIVPGNDDSMKAVELYVKGMADAVLEGKARAKSGDTSEYTEYVEANEEVDSAPSELKQDDAQIAQS